MLHSMSILHSHQPLLQLDLMNRPVHEKTLIDALLCVSTTFFVFLLLFVFFILLWMNFQELSIHKSLDLDDQIINE